MNINDTVYILRHHDHDVRGAEFHLIPVMITGETPTQWVVSYGDHKFNKKTLLRVGWTHTKYWSQRLVDFSSVSDVLDALKELVKEQSKIRK